MRRVSQPFRMKNRPGWYVRWMENGKLKHKQLDNLDEVDMFRLRKFQELNSDVYDMPDLTWQEARDMYLRHYDTDCLAASSKYEARRCLETFTNHFGAIPPKQISQRRVDDFFAILSTKVNSPHTMNKYKGRFKAFVRWLADRNYHTGKIKITMSKVPQAYHPSLTIEQVHALLRHCPTEIWRMRVLLSLVTGLRRDDIESLQVSDVDAPPRVVRTRSRKTGKADVKPLPDALMDKMSAYLESIPSDGPLFPDDQIRITWNKIRQQAGFAEHAGTVSYTKGKKLTRDKWKYLVTRQDFRRTHATLMGLADGLQAAARALEHSSTAVTAQYYSDLSLIQRVRVNQLPVADWLNWEVK